MAESIINENEIDESAARAYLDTEDDIDFFPGAREKLTAVDAAFLLSVSVPTITRMVEDKQICLTKESIKDYIKQNYKHLKPINLTQITPD
ncbi:MAG: hypothetical protein IKQ43_03905 [Treponema sp.]|nr:hypothetical protein [Treponema sp.]